MWTQLNKGMTELAYATKGQEELNQYAASYKELLKRDSMVQQQSTTIIANNNYLWRNRLE